VNDRIRTWVVERSKLEWNPQPIPQLQVDPELTNLCGTQRMVEALRYFILSTEYWISPDGVLREWLRVMAKAGILILCPLVIFMPTVTFALWQVALWVAFLVMITKSLIVFPLAALAAIALSGVLVIVVRSLFTSR
jgi:hypothetical protein